MKNKVRVVVVTGGRDFDARAYIHKKLDKEHARRPIKFLVHGGARGVDLICKEWAIKNGVQPVQCDANWLLYPRAAGPIRNRAMGELVALLPYKRLLAFPGGVGTADMVKVCHKLGIKVKMIPLPKKKRKR